MSQASGWVLSCRYLRALGLGLLRLPIREYMELTFSDLAMLLQAQADAAEMQQGRDPFRTQAQKRDDIEYLRRIARERANGKGQECCSGIISADN